MPKSTESNLTKAQVRILIAKVPKERKRSVVCSLIGHSLIVSGCFGYVYCGRCDAQIGDQLTGVFAGAEKSVRIGHNCDTCRKNYRALDWKHKYLTPNPFKQKAGK